MRSTARFHFCTCPVLASMIYQGVGVESIRGDLFTPRLTQPEVKTTNFVWIGEVLLDIPTSSERPASPR